MSGPDCTWCHECGGRVCVCCTVPAETRCHLCERFRQRIMEETTPASSLYEWQRIWTEVREELAC